MRYSCDDPQAIIAMELERTSYYGEQDDGGLYSGGEGLYGDCGYEENTDICPVCGAYAPEHFYMNDDEECVGCYECVHRVYELF